MPKKKLILPYNEKHPYVSGIVRTKAELRKIFELRKIVYIDELKYLNTNTKFLSDEFDSYSTNFFVKYHNEIIGTARITDEKDGLLELTKDINWKKYLKPKNHYCEITRRIFLPSHRNLFATFILFKEMYDYCIQKNINAVIFGAELKWKKYYRRIGFNVIEDESFFVKSFKSSPKYYIYYAYFDDEKNKSVFNNSINKKLNLNN